MADEHAGLTLTLTDEVSPALQSIHATLDSLGRKMKEVSDQSVQQHRKPKEALDEHARRVKAVEREVRDVAGHIRNSMLGATRSMVEMATATTGMSGAFGEAAVAASRLALALGPGAGLAGAATIAAVGLPAVAFGIYKIAEALNEAYQKQKTFNIEVGETTDKVSAAWRAAGRTMGESADSMDKVLTSLTRKIRDLQYYGGMSTLYGEMVEHGPEGLAIIEKLNAAQQRGASMEERRAIYLEETAKKSEQWRREEAERNGVSLRFMTEGYVHVRRMLELRNSPAWRHAEEARRKASEDLERSVERLAEHWVRIEPGIFAIQTAITRIADGLITAVEWAGKLVDMAVPDWLQKFLLYAPLLLTFPGFAGQLGLGPPRGGRGGSEPDHRQGGGPVAGGTPYMVGEGGPELFVPRTSGNVLAAAAGGSSTMLREIGEEGRESNIYLREMRDVLEWMREQMQQGADGGGGAPTGTGGMPGWLQPGGGAPGGPGGGGAGAPGGGAPGSPGGPAAGAVNWPDPGAGNVMPPGFGGGAPVGGEGAVAPWAGTVAPGGGGAWEGKPVPIPEGWGPGAGGPGGGAMPGAGGAVGTLAEQRAKFAEELKNPAVRDRMAALMQAEVGSQGPQAQQALLESIFNRASARKQTLMRTMQRDYYEPMRTGKFERALGQLNEGQRGAYQGLLDQVLKGSNIANYATGNASGNVGFAGGPQTAAFGPRGNQERYGIEGPDVKWAERTRQAAAGGGGQAQSPPGGVVPGGNPLLTSSMTGRRSNEGGLENYLEYAARVAGVQVDVAHGIEGGHARHKAGAPAYDLDLRDANGRKLDMRNPEDLEKFKTFMEAASAAGATGLGAGTGTNYMGPHRIHVGGGTEAVWGAGGSGANAPGWLSAAAERGRRRRMTPQQVQAELTRMRQQQPAATSPGGGGGVGIPYLDNPLAPKWTPSAGQHQVDTSSTDTTTIDRANGGGKGETKKTVDVTVDFGDKKEDKTEGDNFKKTPEDSKQMESSYEE